MRGVPCAHKTRGLLPQTALLKFLNRIVLNVVNPFLDSWSSEHGLNHCLMGSGKGKQTRDFVFVANSILEKGRDRRGAAGIAGGDIQKCHDVIPWGQTLRGLKRRNVPHEWANALIRLHRCLVVNMVAASCKVLALERTRSALTGSPSAGPAARIVIEDSFSLALPLFTHSFERAEGQVIHGMSWSDNLMTTGDSIGSAINNFQTWRQILMSVFNMSVKDSSCVAIPSITHNCQPYKLEVGGSVWEVKDSDVWLGCEVSGMGKDSGDMNAVKCSWERAFWANARYLRNTRAPVDARVKLWRSISLGIGDYHFAGWRLAIAAGADLEAAHNKILSRIVGLKLEEDDTAASYSIRRNSVISQVKTRHKMCIRSRWANRLVSWVEHLHRHKATWAYQLLVTQDDEWLRIMRLLAGSPSYEAGVTGTRVGRGFPLRWGAGWLEAVSLNGGGGRILSGTNNELLQESP